MQTVQIKLQNADNRQDVLRGLSNEGYFVRARDYIKDGSKYEKAYRIELIISDDVKIFCCDEFDI